MENVRRNLTPSQLELLRIIQSEAAENGGQAANLFNLAVGRLGWDYAQAWRTLQSLRAAGAVQVRLSRPEIGPWRLDILPLVEACE